MSLLQTLLCCLSLCISYAQSQTPALTPQVGSISPGQSFTFNCNVGVKDGWAMYFFKQSPGESPKLIFYHHHSYTAPKYGPGMSSAHFTGTINSAGTEYQLIIKDAQIADTSVYYCLKGYASTKSFVFSQSSKLIVTVDKYPEPAIMVFAPYSEDLSTEDKPIVTCHISKMTVSLANVKWLVDGTTVQEGVSTSHPVRDSDNMYSLSSYIAIPKSDLKGDKTYSCWIQQEGSSAFKSQGIKLSQC
ncbi:immunoglobulin kappa light chain isoform X1 [Bombina bombina]|uniref:immunoglobulin kappa light chain isoform X1 n=1 Tax=Bombina bombina TaxID=8345 RepID=UPI00235AA04E|nr:immunoglobulin kappa light chain isoform X1 [Bombina bombina]